MEENNNDLKVENLESSAVDRKRVSVPLIPFILIVIVGIIVFVVVLKLFVFNKNDKSTNTVPSQEITANIVVESDGLQY